MAKPILTAAILVACGSLMWGADQGKAKESYVKKAGAEIERWNTKADQLQKKAKSAGAETRTEVDHYLKIIREQLEESRKSLEELNGKTDTSWKRFSHQVDVTLDDVKHTYKKATAFLKRSEK